MNTVYVVIKADGDDVQVKAFRKLDSAAAYVMECVYGEDWEIQMSDEEWGQSADIQANYDSLVNDYGFIDAEDVTWSVEEVAVED